MPTWDPNQYLRFDSQRTRPCRELASRVAVAAPRSVMDLGCGPGNSTSVLAARWPEAKLSGLDSSPEMIAAARQANAGGDWQVGDIAAWAAEDGDSFDVVFSNAALQWLGNHAELFPMLMRRVAPGGGMAIQMPGNFDAPAHRVMRELAAFHPWRGRFPKDGIREWHVHDLPFYYDTLASAAATLDFWETEYLHVLPDANAIVEWYKGTGLRPFLDALATSEEQAEFSAAYLEQIRQVYPLRSDGRVLFPFRRLFLIAYK